MEKVALSELDLAKRWGISPKTLQRWRCEGRGPRYLKLSKRVVYTTKTAHSSWNAESAAIRSHLVDTYERLDTQVAIAFGVESLPALREEFGLDRDDILEPKRLFDISYSEWLHRSISLAIGVCVGRWYCPEDANVAALPPEAVFSTIRKPPGRSIGGFARHCAGAGDPPALAQRLE